MAYRILVTLTLLNENRMASNGLMVGMSLAELHGILGDPEPCARSSSGWRYQTTPLFLAGG
jgi:hypothetical protein